MVDFRASFVKGDSLDKGNVAKHQRSLLCAKGGGIFAKNDGGIVNKATQSLSQLRRQLPLHKGAFDMRTFCANFLSVFCSSAIASFQPRSLRVVFVIQEKRTTEVVLFIFQLLKITKLNCLCFLTIASVC